MDIVYKKQAEKYLRKVDITTYNKLKKAIVGLEELHGDIVKLKGSEMYRLKIYHYRIIFTYNINTNAITIEGIGTRGNIY